MTQVDTIAAGIAPSPYAGVGLNVMRAIASYAGKPIDIPRAGTHYGLTEIRRYTVAPPGLIPLRPIRFSLVDVPDLKVLPDLWPSLKSVWVGAGPVPEILHRALNALAWLVRARLVPTLLPLASLMYRVINVLRWGEHRGGMYVAVEGTRADGARAERTWHMLAEGDDGPMVPSMAAEAIIRKHLAGQMPVVGARPATHDLEIGDYEAMFGRRNIRTGIREPIPASEPLYRRLLGAAWDTLPPPLRAMHDLRSDLITSGIATVERGSGLLARIVASVFRFPAAGKEVPVTVSFRKDRDKEIWERNFAGRVMRSTQEEGRGRFERLLCERFGPFAFGLALLVRDGQINLVVRAWTVLGIPLPRALAPGGEAFESVEDGRFRFHVEIAHPLIGRIVRYRGWLAAPA